MATIAHVSTNVSVGKFQQVHKVTWETLTSTNAVGDSAGPEYGADRTVMIIGTFDSATVVIQGSNDGTNWFTLNDLQANAISKTAAALEGIAEFPLYVRPSTTGGSGSQDIDVIMICRRSV